ncbi:MAG: DUF3040 domain-containing protein [Actinomycetaceae bacterium]|nr:DUF3040 domain-containing protein [Actinomycetaceae bacterium]
MALSEQDRQILEQLELQLREDDPALASTLSSQQASKTSTKKTYAPRRVALGISLAVVGLLIPIIGISASSLWITVLIGVLGFALMLTGVLFIAIPTVENPGAAKKPTRRSSSSSSFMEKQQRKWDERKNNP